MNEVNYEKQITSLHAEVIALKELLENEREVTKVWFDIAHEYASVLEPIIDVVYPLAQKKFHQEGVSELRTRIESDIND